MRGRRCDATHHQQVMSCICAMVTLVSTGVCPRAFHSNVCMGYAGVVPVQVAALQDSFEALSRKCTEDEIPELQKVVGLKLEEVSGLKQRGHAPVAATHRPATTPLSG